MRQNALRRCIKTPMRWEIQWESESTGSAQPPTKGDRLPEGVWKWPTDSYDYIFRDRWRCASNNPVYSNSGAYWHRRL